MIRSLVKIIKRVVKTVLATEHDNHIPAQVVSYDGSTNTCSVQPVVKVFRTQDPDNLATVMLPQIDDVPVMQRGSGMFLFSCAPQPDSYGLLHVPDREIETWLQAGGIVDPVKSRSFDATDAIFEPGLYPLVADGDNGLISPAINTDRLEMRTRDGVTFVAVVEDNTIEITADSSSIVMATDGTITINGGSDFAVAYTDLKSAFDQLKSDFDTFVSSKYNTHTHSYLPGPGVATPTAVPIPVGTSSTADMSGAKVDKVKLP